MATPASTPRSGSIAIVAAGPNISVDQVSPRLTALADGRLHVELMPADAETRWVALSPSCFALLNGDFLSGFLASLLNDH